MPPAENIERQITVAVVISVKEPSLLLTMHRVMDLATASKPPRRPRFRRAEPPPFRVTDDDLMIIRLVGQHRFATSRQIAGLTGRSVDRTNDRLSRLYHAGFIDRPKAQLDYYPTKGSSPIVYALADLGAQLLAQRNQVQRGNRELTRRNDEAGRPFIDHQLEITEFYVSLKRATEGLRDVQLIHPAELMAAFPEHTRKASQPLSLRATLFDQGAEHPIGIVPDFAFGLKFAEGRRRCFMVEIDRGTMPIVRADLRQTSFRRKMQAYLAAYGEKQHESRFGWKAFRILTITTDEQRMRSMQGALRHLNIPNSPGASLFLFATQAALRVSDPLRHAWIDGTGGASTLI
jgi:hypothetical protein